MSNGPIPAWQRDRLAGFAACTVANIAAVHARARQSSGAARACPSDPVAGMFDLPTTGDQEKSGP